MEVIFFLSFYFCCQTGAVSACGTPGSGPNSGPMGSGGTGPRRMNNKTKDLVSPKSGKFHLKCVFYTPNV